MNKFGMVFGLAAVATLAGCKDPDYAHAPAGAAQNAPVDVSTPTAVTVTDQPGAVPTPVAPAAKCMCPPGARHTSPCLCGDPNCKCIVEAKAAPLAPVTQPAYTVYIVQNGDYLAKISKRFNVTISSIKRLNPSIKKDVVRVGQKLKIPGNVDVGVQSVPPVAVRSSGKRASASTYTGATKEYVVKNGDTLGSVAYGNGINIRQLKALNGLTSDSLKIGQKLKIPAEKVAKAPKAGKTAAGAAAGKSAAAKADAPSPAPAAAEDAPQPPAEASVAAETNAAPVVEAPKSAAPATTTYTVQEGDDMTGVSIRFAVSAAEIRELNNMGEGDQLKPGTTIKLPAEAVQQ